MEEHNLTQEEIARFVGRSRPAVANALRLLSLPEPVLAHLEQGRLSAGHARALVTLPDEQAAESALQIIKQGLSVRQTEALVKRLTGQPGKRSRGPSFGRSFLKEVELSLTESMGRKVRVSPKGAGGTLSLTFTSEEDLRNLMRQLCRMDGDPIALPPQSLKKGE